MRKIDGLKFLQKYFPDLTVDCLFVDKIENLNEQSLYLKNKNEQIWRVRGGRKSGSELNLPQGTFRTRPFCPIFKSDKLHCIFILHIY